MAMKPRLMAILAHPDDELAVAGTLAACAAEGVEVLLVCATSGDLGSIADPSLATRETLGEVRREELRCSCRRLGIQQPRILSYADSGWRAEHGRPPEGSLALAPPAEVIRGLMGLIRSYRPQVLLTFGPDGLYGHRDHIAIGTYATAAFGAAADRAQTSGPGQKPDPEAWAVRRLFYIAIPEALRELLLAPTGAVAVGRVTHVVDVERYLPAKLAAARCHETQKEMWQGLEALQMVDEYRRVLATEWLMLAQERSSSEPEPEAGPVWRQLLG